MGVAQSMNASIGLLLMMIRMLLMKEKSIDFIFFKISDYVLSCTCSIRRQESSCNILSRYLIY